jgi:hypothetical protein
MAFTFKLVLRINPHFVPADRKVKLSAQFLQCVADISSAPRDSLLTPALLIILYSICFLLLIAELSIEKWEEGREGRRARENQVLDRP